MNLIPELENSINNKANSFDIAMLDIFLYGKICKASLLELKNYALKQFQEFLGWST